MYKKRTAHLHTTTILTPGPLKNDRTTSTIHRSLGHSVLIDDINDDNNILHSCTCTTKSSGGGPPQRSSLARVRVRVFRA